VSKRPVRTHKQGSQSTKQRVIDHQIRQRRIRSIGLQQQQCNLRNRRHAPPTINRHRRQPTFEPTAESERLKELGNDHFRQGNHLDAFDYYTDAIEAAPYGEGIGPRRRAAEASAGQPSFTDRLDEAIDDCTISLLYNPTYTKAYLRRSTAHERNSDTESALLDMTAAYRLQPCPSTKKQMDRLQKIEAERMEKLKEETMGKLKELGNSILGNFGLSLDNFQAVQDPKTGGYSISFNQNK
ncbi:hypothetical protein ACHAWO_009636, partial [Cyclotella atomus]